MMIEVNKNEEASKIVYSVPLTTNIWAYHDSRLWMRQDQTIEPITDLSPALAKHIKFY